MLLCRKVEFYQVKAIILNNAITNLTKYNLKLSVEFKVNCGNTMRCYAITGIFYSQLVSFVLKGTETF